MVAGLGSLGWAAAGGVTGLLVSAVQWIPTAEFLAVTERAHASYAFASSGSLSPAELLVSIVPHVLGGGPIGLESYTGPYNLAELDAYCGMLSLVAIVALVPRWRSEHARHWRVWYLVGGIGLLLALGANTPLERLVIHIPIVGEQRLPSRALVLFSLASSMLLGHWIEDQLSGEARAREPAEGGNRDGRARCRAGSRRRHGFVRRALRGDSSTPLRAQAGRLRAVAPYLVVTVAIALAAGAIVILGPSWPRRRAGVSDRRSGHSRPSLVHREPVFARARARPCPRHRPTRCKPNLPLGSAPGGRYLIVDPALLGRHRSEPDRRT